MHDSPKAVETNFTKFDRERDCLFTANSKNKKTDPQRWSRKNPDKYKRSPVKDKYDCFKKVDHF
jgi:hypothetical protein